MKKVALDGLDVATALLFTDGPWNVPQPEDSMEGNLQVSGDGKMALFAKLMAAWFNMDEQKENAAMPCLEELYRAFDESDKMSDGEAMDRECNIDAMLELFLTSQEYDALRKLAELDDTFANRQTVKQASKFAKRVIDGIYIMDDQKVKIAIAGLEELRTAYDEFDNMPDCEAMVREGELDAMEEQFVVSQKDAYSNDARSFEVFVQLTERIKRESGLSKELFDLYDRYINNPRAATLEEFQKEHTFAHTQQ